MTTVHNVKDGTFDPTNPDHVYIGRANRAHGLAGSKWRNTHKMARESDRASSIEAFAQDVEDNVNWMERDLYELVGKRLYCWCSPKACHGDVLAGLANQLAERGPSSG